MSKEHNEKEKNIQKVYVIQEGTMYEGGSVKEILETYEEAEKWVEKYIKMRDYGDEWEKKGRGWESGCSYIIITPSDILKKAEDSRFFKYENQKNIKIMKSEKN